MSNRDSANHVISEGRLLAFIYETLDDGEKRVVEQHLMTCLRCRIIAKKLNELKEKMENEPKPAINETWQNVRELAEEIEKEDVHSDTVVQTAFGKFGKMISAGFVLPVGIAAAALMVFGFMTLRTQLSVEKIRFLKASESVTVNGKMFFDKVRVDYPVNRKLNLGVQDGECVFQLGKGSVMIAEKNTEFAVEYGNTLTIRLVKGSLIAKVNRMAGDKALRIATSMGSFTMTSAVFYVRNDVNYVECSVKDGEVKSVIGDRTSVINEMTGIRIDSKGKEYIVKIGSDNNGFGRLEKYYLN